MLIGLISDTHIPDRRIKLPEKVLETFEGVDLIIHAGDITSQSVIDELETIAPVVAVEGNMDRVHGEIDLPPSEIIEAEGHKIGVIHGEVYPRGDTQQLYYHALQLEVDILVSGHTALAGTEKVRQLLSEERADAVAEFLIALGVRDRAHIFTQGFGATKPVAPNNTEAGKARNRRVEITILE